MSAKLLEVTNLTASYGDFQALFGIDFNVSAGEAVAIIGANGAGKSTFLRAACGMLAARADNIMFDGSEIGRLAPHKIHRAGVALVPEGRRLFRSLSVEENLLIGATSARAGDWNLAEIYRLFPDLLERRHQMAPTLSGGQQQMVAIGRALMSNPRLLMCDEISLGLAPKIVRDIYARLRSVRERGTAIVVVEQDVEQALAFADRVYCFQEGRVTLQGRPDAFTRQEIVDAYFGMKDAA